MNRRFHGKLNLVLNSNLFFCSKSLLVVFVVELMLWMEIRISSRHFNRIIFKCLPSADFQRTDTVSDIMWELTETCSTACVSYNVQIASVFYGHSRTITYHSQQSCISKMKQSISVSFKRFFFKPSFIDLQEQRFHIFLKDLHF